MTIYNNDTVRAISYDGTIQLNDTSVEEDVAVRQVIASNAVIGGKVYAKEHAFLSHSYAHSLESQGTLQAIDSMLDSVVAHQATLNRCEVEGDLEARSLVLQNTHVKGRVTTSASEEGLVITACKIKTLHIKQIQQPPLSELPRRGPPAAVIDMLRSLPRLGMRGPPGHVLDMLSNMSHMRPARERQPVVILLEGSTVEQIIFEGGNGEVFRSPDSHVGMIIGGHVHQPS